MRKCHIPSCLGHAEERTEQVTCTRCGGQRWTLVPNGQPVLEEYTCTRCRAVLAGRNAADPMVSADRRAHLAQVGAGLILRQRKAPISVGVA
jgi:hypothetical protein